MVNIFLVIATVILIAAIIAGSIYLVVYFQHPEDKNTAWFPKIVVVLGFSLACISILMLPLDVANAETNGGFPMDSLWLSVYIIIAAMVVVVIPFAIFFYESEEAEGENNQVTSAIKGSVATVVVFGALTVILYFFIGIAQIPVIRIDGSVQEGGPVLFAWNIPPVNSTNTTIAVMNATTTDSRSESDTNATRRSLSGEEDDEHYYPQDLQMYFSTRSYYQVLDVHNSSSSSENVTLHNRTYYWYNDTMVTFSLSSSDRNKETLNYRISIVLFIITMVNFGGWFLFVIFGGIGLVAFPMDNVKAFAMRPIPITLEQYTEKKIKIGERAKDLLDIANGIRERQRKGKRQTRRDRNNYNKFRQAVFLLEEDYDYLQTCYKRQGGKIVLAYLQFGLGVIGGGLTLLWLLHIILFMFTQPYPFFPFLNTMVIAMNKVFGLFGTIAYGVFAYYLLLCVIKGNFKFGLRIFFLFPIHPMRVGGTMMNAFLFNVLLILVCTVSITQFCTEAFSDFTSSTAVNSMFSMTVSNLMILKYFFLAFIYILFAIVILTAIFLGIRPRDKPTPIVL